MYTVVGEDYTVTVHRSFEILWMYVNDEQRFLAPDNGIPLTRKALKALLKEKGEARIYKQDQYDWYEKIQTH